MLWFSLCNSTSTDLTELRVAGLVYRMLHASSWGLQYNEPKHTCLVKVNQGNINTCTPLSYLYESKYILPFFQNGCVGRYVGNSCLLTALT